MPDDPRQDEDGSFRKTFFAIAVVHMVVLGGLLLATFYEPKQSNDSVVWMSAGSFAGDSAATQAALTGNRESRPPADQESEQPSQQESGPPEEPASSPPATSPPLPTPQPLVEESALPITSPTATPRPRPTPTPRPKSTAKPASKPTPKPTPKPSPTHSATPRPSPKPQVTPKEKEKEKPKSDDSPKPKTSPSKPEEKGTGNATPGPSVRPAEAAMGKGKLPRDQTTPGRGLQSRSGSGGGAGDGKVAGTGNSALAAYVGILTNRFQSAWNQPTSEMALGKTLEVTVKLKVEADGTVTEFIIVEGSGNAVVDDSVREAGKKITKLPAPPGGQAFSAPVRFELGN